jgi:hypothetical protein
MFAAGELFHLLAENSAPGDLQNVTRLDRLARSTAIF